MMQDTTTPNLTLNPTASSSLPQNNLNDLNSLMASQMPPQPAAATASSSPVTDVNQAQATVGVNMPSMPVEPVMQTAPVAAQMPTENLNVENASQPVMPMTNIVPAVEEVAQPVNQPIAQPETESYMASPAVATVAEPVAVKEEPAVVAPVETVETVAQPVVANPQAEQEEIARLEAQTNAALGMATQIPVAEPASLSSTGMVQNLAPEGELSQVFEMTPSDVVIPPNVEPVAVQQEPAMVPIETNNVIQSVNEVQPIQPVEIPSTSYQVPPMQPVQPAAAQAFSNPGMANLTPVASVQTQPKKSGGFINIVRYILWVFILILGIVAVILGMYLARVINIPFLNSFFGR